MSRLWLIVATWLTVVSCGIADSIKSNADSDDASGTKPTAEPSARPDIDTSDDPNGTKTARVPCTLPTGAPESVDTIDALLTLINLLPKPVTLPCLLDVLPRPLDINASSSVVSVQPAAGDASPRIFIQLDNLVIAMVPDGEGSHLLEMSELLSVATSVKGEIALPVTTPLAPTAPFDRIVRPDDVAGTTCSACHADETKATDARFGGKAFVSRALRQGIFSEVSLTVIRELGKACEGLSTSRCEILKALLGKDETQVRHKPFPQTMPTLF